MILFKTALKNFRKDPLMNIIVFLQLVAVLLVTVIMTSTISIRYRTYDPVKDILEGKGFYASFNGLYGANDSEKYDAVIGRAPPMTVDELNARMNAESAIYVRETYASTLRTYPNTKNNITPILFYDNEMMSRYKPALKSGRWISPDADTLEVVITDENSFGWKLGDTILFDLLVPDGELPAEAKVVGIVEKSSDVFGYNLSRDISNDTYRFMYNTHNSHNHDRLDSPTMLASAEVFDRLYPEVESRITSAIFTYKNGTTDEFIKEDSRRAGQYGAIIIINLEEMNANSKKYLRDELLKLMPVIAVLLVLVIISAVSVSAIAARRRLKDYAKYYLLGLQWKQCALVSFLQALITSVAALLVSIAVLWVISFTTLSGVVTVLVNMRLFLALLGILALYLVFSMIMPLMMLQSSTPKELLQSE